MRDVRPYGDCTGLHQKACTKSQGQNVLKICRTCKGDRQFVNSHLQQPSGRSTARNRARGSGKIAQATDIEQSVANISQSAEAVDRHHGHCNANLNVVQCLAQKSNKMSRRPGINHKTLPAKGAEEPFVPGCSDPRVVRLPALVVTNEHEALDSANNMQHIQRSCVVVPFLGIQPSTRWWKGTYFTMNFLAAEFLGPKSMTFPEW